MIDNPEVPAIWRDFFTFHSSAGAGRRIKYWGRRILGTSKPGQRFGAVLGWLQRSHHNVMVFAILRKVSQEPFRIPIQGIYADAISNADLRADYDPARAATAAE